MPGHNIRENITVSKRLKTQEVFIRFTILTFLLTFAYGFCNASKVAGYIITENSDTLYGEIRVSNFDRITGGWIFNGIDLESYHYQVTFKENGKSHFKTFTPADIQAFGFSYQSSDYIFKRFTLVAKDLFNKEQKRYRFLCLEYNGRISLYQDVVYVINRMNHTTQNDNYTYSEYYLYNASKGLKKLELTRHTKALVELLLFYNMEKDYLELLPAKADLKDIKTILAEYDNWCNKRLTMETKSISKTITAYRQ